MTDKKIVAESHFLTPDGHWSISTVMRPLAPEVDDDSGGRRPVNMEDWQREEIKTRFGVVFGDDQGTRDVDAAMTKVIDKALTRIRDLESERNAIWSALDDEGGDQNAPFLTRALRFIHNSKELQAKLDAALKAKAAEHKMKLSAMRDAELWMTDHAAERKKVQELQENEVDTAAMHRSIDSMAPDIPSGTLSKRVGDLLEMLNTKRHYYKEMEEELEQLKKESGEKKDAKAWFSIGVKTAEERILTRAQDFDVKASDAKKAGFEHNNYSPIAESLMDLRLDIRRLTIPDAKTVTHFKRGTSYAVLGTGRIQAADPLQDDDRVVIYAGLDGQLWARPVHEFNDGRFSEDKG